MVKYCVEKAKKGLRGYRSKKRKRDNNQSAKIETNPLFSPFSLIHS